MSRADAELDRLAAWWDGLPPDVRGPVGDSWGGAIYLLGEGCRVLGNRLDQVKGPVLFLFLEGFRLHIAGAAMAALSKKAPPPNPILVAVEGRFPTLIAFLTTVTGALGLGPPSIPPKADATP